MGVKFNMNLDLGQRQVNGKLKDGITKKLKRLNQNIWGQREWNRIYKNLEIKNNDFFFIPSLYCLP